MHIWEYLELEVKNWPRASEDMSAVEEGKATVGRKNLIAGLNALGGKGWEAFNIEFSQSGLTRVYLKRVRG